MAGGRIATIKEQFTVPVEAGAEFIHGDQKRTFKLLKEAGIEYEEAEGRMIGVRNGKWQKEEHDEHWDDFMRRLRKLDNDTTILLFLNDHFKNAQYRELRLAVQRFAEGFNLADISRASLLSVKDEWKDLEKTQYRVKGGYSRLIDYLLQSVLKNAAVYFNMFVNKIEHRETGVVVHTTDKKTFEGDKLIITVSLGVLQSGEIQFEPGLKEHETAIQSLGFGAVIKFLFEFKTDFWNDLEDKVGFLLTDEDIPTWWTQLPAKNNLLTGWLGGPKAAETVFEPEQSLFDSGLQSLSSIFHVPKSMITAQLVHYKIISWQNNDHTIGGYSYSTLGSTQARNVLNTPINDTVFFAREAVTNTQPPGTVESALQSGYEAAKLLKGSLKKS